jgi:predicted O-linked N-acetylglucosamine transferase (SPINDLY family)
VFARKPAPVQATWLGYLNTTGLRAMDYRICDNCTDPEGETEALNTETLARLPHSQWCYAPYYDIQPATFQSDPGRPVVFGSFNQFVKISDACLDLWAEILREVPDAQLRVHGASTAIASEDFHARLERRGVARARVTILERIGILEYFEAIADADIALDTMPYNGATTTLDTLWMGTPVVGLHGNRAISRGTCSILGEAGLTELIAKDRAGYIATNLRLARDAGYRVGLRNALRARLEASPMMDTGPFVHDVEALFLRMLETR